LFRVDVVSLKEGSRCFRNIQIKKITFHMFEVSQTFYFFRNTTGTSPF